MLGGGVDVAQRRVDDDDATPGRRLHVDVVHADTRPRDDAQPLTRVDQWRGDLGLAAHDQRVVARNDLQQRLGALPMPLIHCGESAQVIHAFGGDGIGDEDAWPLAAWHAGVRMRIRMRA